MAIEKKKLSEVTLVDTPTGTSSVLIEEDGVIKRVPLEIIETNILTKIADGNKEEY